MGRLLFYVLAMVAEFEADLISMRSREGMRVRRKGDYAASSRSSPRCKLSIYSSSPTTGTIELAELSEWAIAESLGHPLLSASLEQLPGPL